MQTTLKDIFFYEIEDDHKEYEELPNLWISDKLEAILDKKYKRLEWVDDLDNEGIRERFYFNQDLIERAYQINEGFVVWKWDTENSGEIEIRITLENSGVDYNIVVSPEVEIHKKVCEYFNIRRDQIESVQYDGYMVQPGESFYDLGIDETANQFKLVTKEQLYLRRDYYFDFDFYLDLEKIEKLKLIDLECKELVSYENIFYVKQPNEQNRNYDKPYSSLVLFMPYYSDNIFESLFSGGENGDPRVYKEDEIIIIIKQIATGINYLKSKNLFKKICMEDILLLEKNDTEIKLSTLELCDMFHSSNENKTEIVSKKGKQTLNFICGFVAFFLMTGANPTPDNKNDPYVLNALEDNMKASKQFKKLVRELMNEDKESELTYNGLLERLEKYEEEKEKEEEK